MGKTTLVEDFLGRVKNERRGLVASGRCSERLAGTEAYLPVLEALESLLQQGPLESTQAPGAAAVLKQVAPLWYAQVATVSGVGGTSAPVLAAAQDSSQERLKREFVAGLLEFSRSRPLVLFLDDLHWADVSTIDLLSYLAGKFAGMRVLVIVTYRSSDLQLAEHPFLQIRPDLQARGVCRELELAFLGESEVRDYLSLEFPEHRFPAGFARLIHAKTEGSPLFMADLLHDMRDRGVVAELEGSWSLVRELPEIEQELPESVRGMVERKIGRLEEEDRNLLTAASVQGHVFDSAVAAVVLDLSPDEVEDRLDALEKVHAFITLVDETELPDNTLSLRYRFVHALYQNELYAALRPTRRARLARAVGEVIEAFHGDRTRGVWPTSWLRCSRSVETISARPTTTWRRHGRPAESALTGRLRLSPTRGLRRCSISMRRPNEPGMNSNCNWPRVSPCGTSRATGIPRRAGPMTVRANFAKKPVTIHGCRRCCSVSGNSTRTRAP